MSYKSMALSTLAAVLAFLVSGCSKKSTDNTTAQLEQQFQEMMNGVTLEGNSTRLNKPGMFGPEQYVIEKVSKVSGETWLFQARLKYGSTDIPVPLPITIKWAGDTPMITLTDFSIPGMGTYTARVLLYKGQYAGTWSGKSGGGQLFGKIVKN